VAHQLPPLPYDFAALEPHIDAQTMQIHHDKHHNAYVTNLNAALEKYPDLQSKSIDNLLRDISKVPEDIRMAVRNNGGGHMNHTMFWQIMGPKGGGAPTGALGDAIYYVHAKDTRIDPVNAGINGVIDTTPGSDFKARAWSYITLGLGHDELWWHKFIAALAAAGYDGVLSIEHEDPAMSAEEGVEKSVELLRRLIVNRPARPQLASK